jgi:hypothetical protein
MITKPVIMPKVASLDLPLAWVSGIISSLITKSMALAAKASPSGNMGWKTAAERLSIALAELVDIKEMSFFKKMWKAVKKWIA